MNNNFRFTTTYTDLPGNMDHNLYIALYDVWQNVYYITLDSLPFDEKTATEISVQQVTENILNGDWIMLCE